MQIRIHVLARACLTLPLLLAFTGCGLGSPGPEPAVVTHPYAPVSAAILNPERGFFASYELAGLLGFGPVRQTGVTLVHLNIRLDDWRETDLPPRLLDDLERTFASIRDSGLKVIPRFAYNAGPWPDSQPDAPKAWVLRHIEQLAPVLQKNADVIAWMEAGFIGAWGEWHTSTNGLDNPADKQDILFALLEALPAPRVVQVRYPANIIAMFPDPAEAARQRVGHHNDCFLASETDMGTYERGAEITIERDQAYLSELTRMTPMSGETCATSPPRSECETALREMALLHFSAINQDYHPAVLRGWGAGGCLDDITNRLGYRLALQTAGFNEQVRPGGMVQLSIALTNEGFAAPLSPRPFIIILANESGEPRYEVEAPVDVRDWQPGPVRIDLQIHIPASAPEGAYHLALWLPDGAASLRDDSRYAIRFANQGVWEEETGLNFLGPVTVTRSAGGAVERSDDFMLVNTDTNPSTETTP